MVYIPKRGSTRKLMVWFWARVLSTLLLRFRKDNRPYPEHICIHLTFFLLPNGEQISLRYNLYKTKFTHFNYTFYKCIKSYNHLHFIISENSLVPFLDHFSPLYPCLWWILIIVTILHPPPRMLCKWNHTIMYYFISSLSFTVMLWDWSLLLVVVDCSI